MNVWISSGTHVDNIAERKSQIKNQLVDPEIIFAEGAEKSTNREQLKSILVIIPVAPLLAAAIAVHIYIAIEIQGKLRSAITGGESGRDVELMRYLSEHYDIEWREIDKEPLGQYVQDHPIVWGITNWGSLFAVTILLLPFQPTVWNIIKYISFLLLIGYIFLICLLAIANYAREETMAQIIANESSKYDRSVVILGEAHHPGVGRRLSRKPRVNIVNPDPKDLDWATQVILRIFSAYDRIK